MNENELNLEKLYATFKQAAENAAAQVYRVSNLSEVGPLIAHIAQEKKANKLVAASSPMVDKALEHWPLDLTIETRNLRHHAEMADIGISQLDMAVAEIGSLQQDCTNLDQRLVSMLPTVHIALVSTQSLVVNLQAAFEKLNENKATLPNYIAFITGPSRTADIERVLTIGVHGPSELKIIFVDQ